jgi:hypothetical protein
MQWEVRPYWAAGHRYLALIERLREMYFCVEAAVCSCKAIN